MVFKYARKDGDPKETAIAGGTVEFAVDSDWAIKNFDCNTFWGRLTGTVRIRRIEGGFVPEYFEQLIYAEGATEPGTRDVYELDEAKRLPSGATLPVSLEDYGLTEPKASLNHGTSPRGGHSPILLANIVLLVALLLLVYLVRRRSSVG